jgi:hypothetical protein
MVEVQQVQSKYLFHPEVNENVLLLNVTTMVVKFLSPTPSMELESGNPFAIQ